MSMNKAPFLENLTKLINSLTALNMTVWDSRPNVKLVPIFAQKAAVAVGGRFMMQLWSHCSLNISFPTATVQQHDLGHTVASSSLEDHVPQIRCGPLSQQEYLAELMNSASA
ncbi:hypothetical protein DPMN_020143 [Dreissena polymorpha]|uniref:Uncharacterized protein n=1 Tax=Dreissena polymorpha TaxID=45954 RepID=A0A9D4NLM8_DREPO|nr:hypothetical protein DPMN_020143 [Dreissena polymorpha]